MWANHLWSPGVSRTDTPLQGHLKETSSRWHSSTCYWPPVCLCVQVCLCACDTLPGLVHVVRRRRRQLPHDGATTDWKTKHIGWLIISYKNKQLAALQIICFPQRDERFLCEATSVQLNSANSGWTFSLQVSGFLATKTSTAKFNLLRQNTPLTTTQIFLFWI